MICTNCGTPIPEDSKFCPTCGTPVPAQPVAPEPPAQPAAPEAPPAPPRALGEKLITVNMPSAKLTSVFRITSAVLAGLFLLFSIYHFYVIIHSAVSGIKDLIYYGSTGSLAYTIIYRLLLAGAAVTACVFLAVGAAAWKPSYAKKFMLGLTIAASIRLLAALINLIRNIFVYVLRYPGGLFNYIITSMPLGLLYTLGYAAAAVLVFFFMYQLDCAPFLGKAKKK